MRLRALVKSQPQAGAWAESLQRQAREALGQSPNPLEQIQTAGKLQGAPEKTQTQEALKDMPRMRALGLAYALTGTPAYLQKARDYVLSWAKTCQAPENPIDATNLEPLLETYDLIQSKLSVADQKTVEDWERSVAQTLLASDNPARGTYWNNWKSHRLKIVALVAFTLDDEDLEKQTLESFRTLLTKNLNPDGTTLDFLERDALHYQVYDLEPLIRTAILYQNAGREDLYDWKTGQGASMRQCVAFVVPFAKGEKTHPEYLHTTVPFDLQRAQNHEKGHVLGGLFEPQAALPCLELAQYFEPDLKAVVANLAGKPDSDTPTLQVLLNEATRRPMPVSGLK